MQMITETFGDSLVASRALEEPTIAGNYGGCMLGIGDAQTGIYYEMLLGLFGMDAHSLELVGQKGRRWVDTCRMAANFMAWH